MEIQIFKYKYILIEYKYFSLKHKIKYLFPLNINIYNFLDKETLNIKKVFLQHFSKHIWKVSRSNFFCRDFWEAGAKNFFFSYCCSKMSTFFTIKIIKISSSYQRFQPELLLATIQSYFEKHNLFQYSFSSCFCRLYCWLHYVASFCIKLFRSLCAYTLKFVFSSLLKLAC